MSWTVKSNVKNKKIIIGHDYNVEKPILTRPIRNDSIYRYRTNGLYYRHITNENSVSYTHTHTHTHTHTCSMFMALFSADYLILTWAWQTLTAAITQALF